MSSQMIAIPTESLMALADLLCCLCEQESEEPKEKPAQLSPSTMRTGKWESTIAARENSPDAPAVLVAWNEHGLYVKDSCLNLDVALKRQSEFHSLIENERTLPT